MEGFGGTRFDWSLVQQLHVSPGNCMCALYSICMASPGFLLPCMTVQQYNGATVQQCILYNGEGGVT